MSELTSQGVKLNPIISLIITENSGLGSDLEKRCVQGQGQRPFGPGNRGVQTIDNGAPQGSSLGPDLFMACPDFANILLHGM